MGKSNENIRNLAIIAHVDHGKTTLVDSLLKQGRLSRDSEKLGSLIMDSNPLERERGITILAKNTAVTYKDIKINIIDTPGHADFSGEVERIMHMANGCLLVIDAVDGPMPQTRFVLDQALNKDVVPMVLINKIDRPEARIEEVIEMVQDLFLDTAKSADQLDFPILYSSARDGYAINDLDSPKLDMSPLLDSIIEHIPAPKGDADASLQMLVAALDYDVYLGQIAIGRIFNGSINPKKQVCLIKGIDGTNNSYFVEKVHIFDGVNRFEVNNAHAGDIIAVSGLEDISIGDTICDLENPLPLPSIHIDEPTVKMTILVNNSPFMGKEGVHCTSRLILDRLNQELKTNLSLKVESTSTPDAFIISGRGELHLSVLLETMRRELYEFQVSKPEPVFKKINNIIHEPYEHLIMDTSQEFLGALTEELVSRLGKFSNMTTNPDGNIRLEYDIPTRGLIGFRSIFIRITRGNGILNSVFDKFKPKSGEIKLRTAGRLVASQNGKAVSYGLLNSQERGSTFVEPGTDIYQGMIVGMHSRNQDILVNVCKEKKLTNMRSSTADIVKRLSPSINMTLEESLDFLSIDELLEITPKNIRLRKRELIQ